MSKLNHILEQILGLSKAEQLSLAHKLLDLISNSTIVEKGKSVSFEDPPFCFFKEKPTDFRVTQFLLLIWSEKSPLEANHDEIAFRLNISLDRLRHLFPENVGLSFKECLKRIAMEKCKIQMVQSNENITSIALDHGFENPSSFTRTFKRFFEAGPREYKNMCDSG